MDHIWRTSTVLYLFALITLSSCAAKPCSVGEINKCMKLFDGYEYDYDNAIVPTMNETVFKEHCRRYDLFEACMADVRPQCSTTDKLVYDGIEKAYQWMCYDAIDEYLKHRECFSTKDLHKEGDVCNDTLTNSLAGLDPNRDASFRADRICQYVNQYLDCVENVVKSFCGKDAADWQRTLDIKSLDPLLSAIDCPLGKDRTHNSKGKVNDWIIIFSIILPLLTIIIITVAVIMIIMQKRKRRLANRQPAGAPAVEANAPPPYQPYMVYNPSGQAVNMQQAGPLPDKSGFVDPPPYQPGAPITESTSSAVAPSYTQQELVPGSNVDEAVAAGYFGDNSDVSPRPKQPSTKKVEGDERPYEVLQ